MRTILFTFLLTLIGIGSISASEQIAWRLLLSDDQSNQPAYVVKLVAGQMLGKYRVDYSTNLVSRTDIVEAETQTPTKQAESKQVQDVKLRYSEAQDPITQAQKTKAAAERWNAKDYSSDVAITKEKLNEIRTVTTKYLEDQKNGLNNADKYTDPTIVQFCEYNQIKSVYGFANLTDYRLLGISTRESMWIHSDVIRVFDLLFLARAIGKDTLDSAFYNRNTIVVLVNIKAGSHNGEFPVWREYAIRIDPNSMKIVTGIVNIVYDDKVLYRVTTEFEK